MRRGCTRGALALWLVAAVAGPVPASGARSWTDDSLEAFRRGTLQGVSAEGDGSLRPAPELVPLLEGAAPRFWSVTVDDRNRIWAAGGGEGRLHRVDPDGTHQQVFRAEEPEVLAVVASGASVYAATGPQGRLYRFRDGEEPEVALEPEVRYIWDLAMGPRGRVHLATGDPARIYRLEQDGSATILLETSERHVRALAFAADGSVLAVTDGEGYLYRVRTDGAAFVLFAPAENELTDVVVAPSGAIYVAGVGEASSSAATDRPRIQGGVARITVSAAAADPDSGGVPEIPPPARGGGGPLASSVYVVDADGTPSRMLVSKQELVLSLGLTTLEELIAGTGEMGALLRIRKVGPADRMRVLPVSQIVALAPDRRGGTVLATANPGSIYRLLDRPGGAGVYLSEVKDAGRIADWGRISWLRSGGGTVQVTVRTGNTARPDATWSGWSEPLRDASGTGMDRPAARFLQYRLRLRPDPPTKGPVVRSVEVFYLQRNAAPVVEEMEELPPGIVMLSGANQRPPDQEAVARAEAMANGDGPEGQRATPRKTFREGMRTFTWSATDPNEDELRFEVLYRLDGEESWKPLTRILEESFLSFDSRQLADGRYRLQVVAVDTPSNAPDRALRGEVVSGPFDVDNTPPSVLDLRHRGDGAIVFRVEDGLGPIARVRYSVDAADWIPVLPEDGVADSAQETYRLSLADIHRGGQAVVVQAEDAAGNLGSGRLMLPPR